jgi:ankyrin repeat protein
MLQVMRLLLDAGALVNVRDKYGHTPLHRAAAQGHIHAVTLLLSTPRCSFDITDAQGNTPL